MTVLLSRHSYKAIYNYYTYQLWLVFCKYVFRANTVYINEVLFFLLYIMKDNEMVE